MAPVLSLPSLWRRLTLAPRSASLFSSRIRPVIVYNESCARRPAGRPSSRSRRLMRPMMERLRSLFINAVFLSLLSLLEYELEGAFNRSVNFLKRLVDRPKSSAGPCSRERGPAALWAKDRVGLLRRADAIVEGGQCCLRAFAHSDDDLLVGHRRAVASGIDAGDRGAAALVDDDLATA